MDHRELYKSQTNSSQRRTSAKSLAERRQRNRHDIHAAQRCISEEPPHVDQPPHNVTASSSSSTLDASAAVVAPPPPEPPAQRLSKQQLHQLKYQAWREAKQKIKQLAAADTSAAPRRPFTSAVPAKRFLQSAADQQQSVTLPRSQHFRPPANLPTIAGGLNVFAMSLPHRRAVGPLNNPIVTRSMAAAAATAAAAAAAAKSMPKPERIDRIERTKLTAVVPKKPRAAVPLPPSSAPFKFPATSANTKRPTTASAALPKKPTRPAIRVTVSKPTKPVRKHIAASQPTAVATLAPQPTIATVETSQLLTFVDTSAVGSPFVADGSMITSTAQKSHTKRSVTPDAIQLDLFSPIVPPEQQQQRGGGGSNHNAKVLLHKITEHPAPVAATNRVADNEVAAAVDANAVDELNTTPLAVRLDDEPNNYVSPNVSIARGKFSARKERRQRESMYRLDGATTAGGGSAETAFRAPVEPVEVRQRREAAAYFRKQLSDETARLGGMASDWVDYKLANADRLLEHYVDLIDVTVGQTRLLLAKKFKQFGGLIEECAAGVKDGGQPVHAGDLEGFWVMMYMQVENCLARFDRLEALRKRDWVEEVDVAEVKEVVRPAVAKKKTVPKMPRNGNPFLEQIKKASRQRLLEQQEKEKEQQRIAEEAAAADASFPMRKTPRKSMLAAVLCNEAAKTTPRRQTMMAPVAGKSPALNFVAVAKKASPLKSPKTTRSILKTPAAKKVASRGVAFAVSPSMESNSSGSSSTSSALSPGTPKQRRPQRNGGLRFVCTPMLKKREADEDDESAENDENDSQAGQHDFSVPMDRRQRRSFCVTPKRGEVEPILRAADQFSLLDSPVVGLSRLTLGGEQKPQKQQQPIRTTGGRRRN